jgi:hypothetical protein
MDPNFFLSITEFLTAFHNFCSQILHFNMVTEVNEFVTVVVYNSNYFSMSLLQQYIYSYPFIYRPVNFKMTFVSRRDVKYLCVILTLSFNLVIFDDNDWFGHLKFIVIYVISRLQHVFGGIKKTCHPEI